MHLECFSRVSWIERGEKPYHRRQHLPSSISGSEVIIVNQTVATILNSAFISRRIRGDFYVLL